MLRFDTNALRDMICTATRDLPDADRTGLRESFEALVADAARFAGLRLVITEPDAVLRMKMFAVFERLIPENEEDCPTVEKVNAVFDAVLAECSKVCNANN